MGFRSLRLSRLVVVAPTPEKEVVIASAALTGNQASSKAGGVAFQKKVGIPLKGLNKRYPSLSSDLPESLSCQLQPPFLFETCKPSIFEPWVLGGVFWKVANGDGDPYNMTWIFDQGPYLLHISLFYMFRSWQNFYSISSHALQSIDRDISSSLDYRRKPRDGVSSASAFYDAGTFTKSPFASIPEALRPKPGRLSNTQHRVYEDFVSWFCQLWPLSSHCSTRFLESLITKDAREAEIQGAIAEVPEMILKCVSRDEADLVVAQK
ncbi:hypothetical protein MRB53_020840 [Persea americana]|uniref:Uncharacterized protein n=1 Tax=Persea americana TaxID=3435 RepID=A0ACC2L2P1_PERAE|nr:hypothetical protein MRB53_020840 [Persea americana]